MMREHSLLRVVLWIGVGLVAGLSLGLVVGWVVWPLEVSEADPSVLEDDYQYDYTVMIAGAYAVEGDLGAAERRLRSLGKESPPAWVAEITVEHILRGGDETEIRHLARLAAALGADTPTMAPFLTEEEPPGS
jgi:hypothetical protein